jgi:tRNA A37 threonylcarbamoyladenosine modification protein TsaB
LVSDPPLILAFDTAAAHCAAVLVRGDRVLARAFEATERGHAERLLPMIEGVLAEAGVPWQEIGGIGVCTGPGNFTGLRVAVAAARGLALALGVPAAGVSRLEVLGERPGLTVATIVDKRGRFVQVFRDGVAEAPPAVDPGATPDGPVVDGTGMPCDLVVLALIAARRLGSAPPPAPLYLRPADAMPPSEAPPAILDDPR